MVHRHRGMWVVAAAAAIPLWIGCAAGVTTGGGGGSDEGDGGDSTGEATASAGVGGGGGGGSSTTASTGTGQPGKPCGDVTQCSELNSPCTVGACINGACQTLPSNEYGSCDDGVYCTEDDICVSGVCVGGSQRFCASLDSCHLGVCDEELKTCKNIPGNDGAQCEDGNPCTNTGYCMAGACAPGAQIDCSIFDGECSVGICDQALGCKAAPKNDGVACDDGQGSPCTTGQCSQGSCMSIPINNGGQCDDGLFCTIGDHCDAGNCVQGQPNPCAPPGGCYIASCDEFTDQCTAVPGNNGQPCDDGSVCTDGSTCSNGACIGGVPVNEGVACDDGSMCTNGEKCSAGLCTGGAGITVYFSEDFSDNNAGWVLGPEWQIGFATASQNGVFGADPSVDHSPTGDNGVAGVVIGGNASTNLHDYYYLESPVFNTAVAPGQVILGFYRWLNSDYDPYMHNNIEVWNGNTWTEIWNSGPPPGVQDSPPQGLGWTFIQHNITQYKSAQMRIRFGFNVTSGGVYTIGSWNIDDILVAEQPCP